MIHHLQETYALNEEDLMSANSYSSPNISIVQGTNSKPVSSNALTNFFSSTDNIDGELFIGYPIISSPHGRYPIDAIWVSPVKGIIIFDLIEGRDLENYDIKQDDDANKIEARLKTYRELVDRRNLVIPIHTISFAPGVENNLLESRYIESYPLVNEESIQTELNKFEWTNKEVHHYEFTLSALQSISTIRRSKTKRLVKNKNSRGAKLKNLEESIATLDNIQGKAVIETVKGVQRIRGLAGSGKTIVLALKAAYLHAQHPDWRIGVTFHTRSLKGQFKRLINTFSIEQTGEEPDWNQLKILNAWGAPGGEEREGIYFQFCKSFNAEYFDFRSAKGKFGGNKAFSEACRNALEHASDIKKLYDVILIDEAQDFPTSFLRLCYEILSDEKMLVYAYDELQNLSNSSLPSPPEIFGLTQDGKPRVTFPESSSNEPKRDIILEKCYRNSRPVLVTAHALGFGIYRQKPKNTTTGLVQIFDESELWSDIGYEVRSGELKDNSNVVLSRKSEASPLFLEQHSSFDDLIQFKCFNNEEEQSNWVVDSIIKNLNDDELCYEDIVVINPDPITTRKKVGLIRKLLLQKDINSHLAGVDTNPDVFFKPSVNSITFTGIYRAKGNEAGMVYIINAHDCHSSSINLATIRNQLFTAITRSKAWVRVLGVGPDMQKLIEEYSKLQENNFELQFKYPNQVEREKLSIIHRDMTPQEQSQLKKRQKNIKELVEDLESGIVHIEDLDEDLISKLNNILNQQDYGEK